MLAMGLLLGAAVLPPATAPVELHRGKLDHFTGRIAVTAPGEQQLKGIPQPVQVYNLESGTP